MCRIMLKLFFLLFILQCTAPQSENQNEDQKGGQKTVDFQKPPQNPILQADSTFTFFDPIKQADVQWQRADVFNPAAIVRDGKICLLFRAEDDPEAILGGRTSRIGLAYSEDGLHFEKHPIPVLFPAKDDYQQYDYPGGCEDPRVVQTEGGQYVMAYTAWNQEVARLSIAFSEDLLNWEKKGPAFAKAYEGKFLNQWSKSASMVTRMLGDRQILAKIEGKYWMYWGENFINLAWSENLYDWYPLLTEEGKLKEIVQPRKNKFDSHLTECGPPAIVIDNRVILFYNGRNSESDTLADPDLAKGTYTVGKLVFDANDLEKVVERSENYLLKPTLPHETTGQYQSGTTFAEGLVFFKSKWFLYYGTADSFVGVAIANEID